MSVTVPLLGWLRTPVAPRHGALRHRAPHELMAPLIKALLARTGVPPTAVDAVILGNALGAGGNPARLGMLAAGLPECCHAVSLDTQCCAGLDAIRMSASLLLAGQADILIAGGVEAWSRAPIRQHRPWETGQSPISYERPAFTPWPEQDPDPIEAAVRYAAQHGWTRAQQDDYARQAHQRAVTWAAGMDANQPILPLDGLVADSYPRLLAERLLPRLPVQQAAHDPAGTDCSLSLLAISPEADGAAVVLMTSPAACQRFGLQPQAHWVDGLSVGTDPTNPMLGAQVAARQLLARHGLHPEMLASVELHDAFAVQGLAFQKALGLAPWQLNPGGGGLARGHPIGASGAIALVDLLQRLVEDRKRQKKGCELPPMANAPRAGTTGFGLAAIAAAGGLGAAALVRH
ncbi:MAG: thiolase family protein [Lautropia sp.]|nr:thiolase family protein [Lautropia sp.]